MTILPEYPNNGRACDCRGGCSFTSLGFHHEGAICLLNRIPGDIFSTMANPKGKIGGEHLCGNDISHRQRLYALKAREEAA